LLLLPPGLVVKLTERECLQYVRLLVSWFFVWLGVESEREVVPLAAELVALVFFNNWTDLALHVFG
jgi:hypothetical protein